MSTEEKQIAIAEAHGWVPVKFEHAAERRAWQKEGFTTPEGWTQHWLEELPDYFNDLNAMHEAEKALLSDDARKGMRAAYGNNLAKVVGFAGDGTWIDDFLMIHATAAQRAEAFGETLNLWK